jgi:predicted RNA-binding protein with TRAM domain
MQGRNQGYDQGYGRTPPVNVGDEMDVKIEAVGEKGDGVAKKDGFVLFVPNVKQGDEVRIKITRVLKKVGFAEVLGKSQGPIEAPQAATTYQKKEVPKEEPDYDSSNDSEDFGEESEGYSDDSTSDESTDFADEEETKE